MKIAAIVAHPDDEVIGCGATLAKLAEAGHDVRALLPLRRGDPRGVTEWRNLIGAFEQACAILGVRPVVLDDLIDERLVEGNIHRLHDAIVPTVDWADTIFSHWPDDTNQVHRALSRAVEVATRPFRRRKEVYLFEVPTSTEQGFRPTFAANSYALVDAHHVERKCAAMARYASELEPGRSPASLRRRLGLRGEEAGAAFAEAFNLCHHFF